MDGCNGRRRGVAVAVLLAAASLAATRCGGHAASDGASRSTAPARGPLLHLDTTPHRARIVSPGHGKGHPVRVAPRTLERVPAAQWKDVDLDKKMKGKRPYYLRFSFTNTGKKKIIGDLFRFDGPGLKVAGGRFGTEVYRFYGGRCFFGSRAARPGQTRTLCYTFMVDKGHSPTAVLFSDGSAQQLKWPVGPSGDRTGGSDPNSGQ